MVQVCQINDNTIIVNKNRLGGITPKGAILSQFCDIILITKCRY